MVRSAGAARVGGSKGGTVKPRAPGLRLPGDLVVVGFDNLETCHPAGLSFPATSPDFRPAGEIATDLALPTVLPSAPAGHKPRALCCGQGLTRRGG